MFGNQKGSLHLHFSALCDIFRKKNFFESFKFFSKKNVLRFLSLRYSANFRRSRLVPFPLTFKERISIETRSELNELFKSFSILKKDIYFLKLRELRGNSIESKLLLKQYHLEKCGVTKVDPIFRFSFSRLNRLSSA